MEDNKAYDTKNPSIWVKGIKSILNHHKVELLYYLDMLNRSQRTLVKNDIDFLKGRVHANLSQAAISVGILVETLRTGGDIRPFEYELNRKETDIKNGSSNQYDNKKKYHKKPYKSFNNISNNNPENVKKLNHAATTVSPGA